MQEYEQLLPGHANMLSGLIAPAWSGCPDVFRERFVDLCSGFFWNGKSMFSYTRCNVVTSRVAVVSGNSRPEVRAALPTHITTIRKDNQRLRTVFSDFLKSGLACVASGMMSGTTSTTMSSGAVRDRG